ncbi:nucleoside-diphosphate sugar epimerase/dehydratase [Geothrix sp. PMB-07]|uniref:polysaccharide biosynthesis protein n=1 Tax=Geothrix sp. PMB-07 TaxID=3068640 RepID=UPI0027419AC6|nr:nucleoside-diphosphate sugar epimerase/dehydratase [Geothrix sp. PMB-07]WLT29993.1 nucleoside-diphosphate sugar epimerase/dehydratase [Geothrix sp. PMB-07]
MPPERESIPQRVQTLALQISSRPAVRQAVKLFLDAAAAGIAWVAATSLVHFEFPRLLPLLIWVSFAMAVNATFQHTRQHYRLVGFVELRSLLMSMMVMVAVALACYVTTVYFKIGVAHPEVALAASLLTTLTWVVLRAASAELFKRRFQKQNPHRPTVDRRKAPRGGRSLANDLALRTLIVGAGQAGSRLCQELQSNPKLRSHVVGFLDDALEKQGVRIHGVPVLGPCGMLPTFIKEAQASQVILAIPSAPGSRIRELAKALQGEGVRVKTLPSMQDLLGKEAWKPELRDIAIEDLLRREPIQLDLGSIQQALTDSVVLITGAGGSIGSELARQVAHFGPSRLILLGRGENSLWGVEREIRRLHPELALEVELCDIRNALRLQQVFEAWRPAFVFHAAAHKHVPYLENHPEEGIENNIFGTLNVLNAAKSVGTRKFVNISTDKAVNPTSVLGVTKRVAEFLVLRAAESELGDGRYMSVRFGNVLGSRGSVIPLFHEQIRQGGPITVTHPEMTRYFMTIPEASQLVLQAGLLGRTGQVFVLDMGEPVRIVDLAADMARLSGLTPGFDIDIQFSGIRPGEKLFEELFTDKEHRQSEVHSKVFEASPEPRNRAVLDRALSALKEAMDLPEDLRQTAFVQTFMELVPAYAPSPNGLGKYLAVKAVGAPLVAPAPKIVVLRPTPPLAQAQP